MGHDGVVGITGSLPHAGGSRRNVLPSRCRYHHQLRRHGGTSTLGTTSLVERYYDPATGQFLTVDPLVDETGQSYVYAGDDPVNESDPSGLYPGENLVHKALNVLAVPIYAEYYLPYEAGKAINNVGCSLGAAGCVASHAAILGTPIPELEVVGLSGDVGLDWVKNKTTGNAESIYDEDLYGSVLPRGWGGPITWLPGISKNACGQIHIDFEG